MLAETSEPGILHHVLQGLPGVEGGEPKDVHAGEASGAIFTSSVKRITHDIMLIGFTRLYVEHGGRIRADWGVCIAQVQKKSSPAKRGSSASPAGKKQQATPGSKRKSPLANSQKEAKQLRLNEGTSTAKGGLMHAANRRISSFAQIPVVARDEE